MDLEELTLLNEFLSDCDCHCDCDKDIFRMAKKKRKKKKPPLTSRIRRPGLSMDRIKSLRRQIGAAYLASKMSSEALDRDKIIDKDRIEAQRHLIGEKFGVKGPRGTRYLPFLDHSMKAVNARNHLLTMIGLAKEIKEKERILAEQVDDLEASLGGLRLGSSGLSESLKNMTL